MKRKSKNNNKLFTFFIYIVPLIGAEISSYYYPIKSYNRKIIKHQIKYYRAYQSISNKKQWEMNLYFFILKEDYREYSSSGIIDRDYSNWGELKGFGIRGTWNKFIYGKFEYAYGDTHYVGATWSGEPLDNDQTGTWIVNMEGGLQLSSSGIIIGLGYRSWNRGNSGQPGDYDEIYYWPYFQVGYKMEFSTTVGEISPEISYQYAFSPKMKAFLGSTPTFDLGTVTGYRVELPWIINLSYNFNLFMLYRYQYWEISGSGPTPAVINKKTYTLYEPPSKTSNHYIGIGIQGRF